MGNLNFDFLDEMEAKEKEREDLLNLEGDLAFAEAESTNEGKVTLTPRQIKIQAARRFAMVGKEDNLAEILTKLEPPGLPVPGEEIHIIANVFDFWTVVPIILRKHRRIEELYISTWAIAMPQARDIVERIQTGQIGRVFLTCGTYMKRREPVVFSYLYESLVRSGGGVKCFETHVKVITAAAGDGDFYSVEGSANLTNNPRLEQISIYNDESLHRFHKKWITDALQFRTERLAPW